MTKIHWGFGYHAYREEVGCTIFLPIFIGVYQGIAKAIDDGNPVLNLSTRPWAQPILNALWSDTKPSPQQLNN